ncbi:hypothetical protein QAD02_000988 [Eretmocerus hayati]|uniref:Uncharacterized protein n=1 Tax=Eretmocerus hayati TaxID=131215 RepID=A0ACC2NER0_9HYME|nr:hypothetical protein QAD02_000988 [Eretmocerus hayati]
MLVTTQDAFSDWFKPKTQWERSVMRKQARLARVLSIITFTGILARVISLCLIPLFDITPRILNEVIDPGMNKGRFFPIQALYPFDAMATPIFEVMYIMNVLNICICAICFTSPDSIFGALVLHASAQFEIVGANMRRIFDEPINISTSNGKKLLKLRLKEVVDAHIRCIKFVEKIEQIFNMIIFSQLIGMCLVLCFIGFGIVNIFIYCGASEILNDHSTNLVDSAYSSKWFDMPSEYSRQLIPIMARSKIPMRLTAGKFVDLSLNTFLKVSTSMTINGFS